MSKFTVPLANVHPCYAKNLRSWYEQRIVYEGGECFVNSYLKKFSKRESDEDFQTRKEVSYPTAYAASAIDDVRNSIYQRLVDVTRTGGSKSYQEATRGKLQGVDLNGSDMDQFIGLELLPEMLLQGKVGVLVDMESDVGITLADKGDKHPYLEIYRAEDILYWYPEKPVNGYETILTQEVYYPDVEDFTGSTPLLYEILYRHYKKTPEGVQIDTWTSEKPDKVTTFLDVERIPFHIFEMRRSLMHNVSKYEIALMNLESADLSYAMYGNFPFYYEFFDPKNDQAYGKAPGPNDGTATASEDKNRVNEIAVGPHKGVRVPVSGREPGFINPSSETLEIAMKKEAELKKDIEHLVYLNLSTLATRTGTARTKDQGSLEAGLSYIGMIIEKGEKEISAFWEMFEKGKQATIHYPETYNIKTDVERFDQAGKLTQLSKDVPSKTFKKEMNKDVVDIMYRGKKEESLIGKIKEEIESSQTVTTDPEILFQANERGLLGDVSASNALGFDGEKEVEAGRTDRAERIKMTLVAQTPQDQIPGGSARGVDDLDVGQRTSSEEKEGKPKRGPANGPISE